MSDEPQEDADNYPAGGVGVGVGVALGAGFGAVMFAITDNPVWIGLGTGIGIALGAARQVMQKGE